MAGQVIRELVSQNYSDYKFVQAATDIENGMILAVGALAEGKRDVYVAQAAADASAEKELWIATGVELQYDERKLRNTYVNEAGKPFRVERVQFGGIYAVSADVLTFATDKATNLKVGALACAVDGATKIKLAPSAATNDVALGVVREIETRGGVEYAVIEFYHD